MEGLRLGLEMHSWDLQHKHIALSFRSTVPGLLGLGKQIFDEENTLTSLWHFPPQDSNQASTCSLSSQKNGWYWFEAPQKNLTTGMILKHNLMKSINRPLKPWSKVLHKSICVIASTRPNLQFYEPMPASQSLHPSLINLRDGIYFSNNMLLNIRQVPEWPSNRGNMNSWEYLMVINTDVPDRMLSAQQVDVTHFPEFCKAVWSLRCDYLGVMFE